MKKKIFIISLILVVLAIAGGYFYTTLSPNNNGINNDIINSIANSELNNSISTQEDITENNTNSQQNNIANNITNNGQNEVTNNTNNEENELFAEFYDKAENMLSQMTLEEKVGQMFLARYPTSDVINEIKNYNPAGYILFGRDFENETKDSIKQKIQNCQDASKTSLAIGVDEEGGTVVRVSRYKAFRAYPFKSPRKVYAEGGMDTIISDSHEKSALLKSLGINMNLAPVVDVPESSDDFIYDRAFSTNVEEVRQYTNKIINTMNSDNMTSVMKHFPGYGNNIDTHTGIAIDKRGYSNFNNRDLIPFEEGIKEGAPAILVSHNIVESMDSSKPASLSSNVHNVLRNELGFSGIIITDDLAMDAVKEYVENGSAAAQAVIAGNDLIISSDFVNQRNEVLQAINEGKISEDTINNAVRRVLAWKLKYKIIQ